MLVNLPAALRKKGMTLRRIAILELLNRQPMHSTALSRKLGVSRQLIDREMGILSTARLTRTDPAKVGTATKPHHLTAAGVKLLADLASQEDHEHYGRTKAQIRSSQRQAAEE